jgi:hypothetical protein
MLAVSASVLPVGAWRPFADMVVIEVLGDLVGGVFRIVGEPIGNG